MSYTITVRKLNRFTREMRARIEEGDWKSPLSRARLKRKLQSNLRRGDFVDVANYALMLALSP